MSGELQFKRIYAAYGPGVRAFERSPQIAEIIAGIICRWAYPISAIIGNKLSSQWLSEGERDDESLEDLDLLFEMPEEGFIEIVLRDADALPVYGGWLVHGQVTVTNEVMNGYRVINVVDESNETIRHEYEETFGYSPTETATSLTTKARARLTGSKAA